MSFFRRPDYASDTTQFIDQLKAKKPVKDVSNLVLVKFVFDMKLSVLTISILKFEVVYFQLLFRQV